MRGRFPQLSSLRWRLSLGISGLVLLCTALCVAGAFVFLSQSLTDRARADVNRTLSGVSGYMRDQGTDLLGAAQLVADDQNVAQYVQQRDGQAVIVYLTSYYADLNVDVMDITDAHGVVLGRMENTLASGDSARSLAGVREALTGHPAVLPESDLSSKEEANGYALRATVPIRVLGKVVGTVAVGRQLGSNFALRIGHAANANVNLIADGQRTGTTLSDSQGLPATGLPEPKQILQRIAAGRAGIAQVREDGQDVLSGLVLLRGQGGHPVGAIEIVRPLGEVYDVIRKLSILLIVLGVLVVAFGTTLGWSISRRLTSRLLALESTASEVAALAQTNAPLGDLHVTPTVQGKDEVASLGRSFGAMMSALDERMAANAELYSAAEARVRELSGLAEIARLLTGVSSLPETLDTLGERVCRLVGSTAVAIWLPGQGSLPALRGGHGLPSGYDALSEPSLENVPLEDETSAQAAMRTGEIAYRTLLGPAPNGASEQRRSVRTLLQSLGWKSATAVPLRVQGRIVGALTCYSESERELPESDLSLLATIADQVAIVVENARLAAEALRERDEQYRSIFESTSDGFVITDLDGTIVEANAAACSMHGLSYEEFVGRSRIELMHPDDQNLVREGIDAVRAGRTIEAQARAVKSDGTFFNVDIHASGLTYNGQLHVLAVLRDITERVQAYELLEQRVTERTHELTTLLDVSHNVASTLELQPLLDLVLEQVKLVVDYDGAALLLAQGNDLAVLARRAAGPDPNAGPELYPGDKVARIVDYMKSGRSVVIDDVRANTPLARAYRESVGQYLDSAFQRERSLMAVPMMIKDRMVGALALSSEQVGFFTTRHEVLTLAIANQAAVAIENARLYERAQEVAALEERQRLARELHDSVSQALYGIALGARTARTLLDRDSSRVAEPLEYVLAQAAAGLAEMRALIFELRPEALATEGLVAALEKQVESTRARHGVHVTASLMDEPDIAFPLKESIYRIAQEALHNTVKHARAQSAELRLEWVDRGIMLEVGDDGRGFEPEGDFPGHLGLKTMRERATQHQGTLEVESSPSCGTRIRAWLPVASPVSRAS